jgi:hypothetical protein
MKFSIALFAILSAAPTIVQAGIPTCSDQKDCLGFTITKVDPDACSSTSAACEFNICMTLQFGGSCDKGTSETVSHTCEKASNVCQVGGADGGSFESAAETKSLPNGYSACQAVSPGGFAEFLVKDANGNCGTADLAITGGTANCQKLETMTNFDSCTGNVNKECVWTIQAPECGTTTADSDSDNRIGTSGSDSTTAEEDAYLCA